MSHVQAAHDSLAPTRQGWLRPPSWTPYTPAQSPGLLVGLSSPSWPAGANRSVGSTEATSMSCLLLSIGRSRAAPGSPYPVNRMSKVCVKTGNCGCGGRGGVGPKALVASLSPLCGRPAQEGWMVHEANTCGLLHRPLLAPRCGRKAGFCPTAGRATFLIQLPLS